MESYEKKYKEALELARDYYKANLTLNNADENAVLEDIFPELKESEDEKIRKAILTGLIDCRDTPDLRWSNFGGISIDDCISWLDKQGEQKALCVKCKKEHPSHFCQDITALGRCALEHGQKSADKKVEPKFKVGDIMRTLQEAKDGYTDGLPVVVFIDSEYYHCTNELIAIKDQDGYEFPAINIKPKFKVGDWIVDTIIGGVWHIDSINKDYYKVSDGRGNDTYCPIIRQDEIHLWSIEDAKKGDVLVASDESIFIYAGSTDRHAKFYVALTNYGTFNFEGGKWEDKNAVHPATKKQRDVLFTKMRESGYEWDAEKKKPKKIELHNSDKAGPKFNVGDWIVNYNSGGVYQVTEIRDDEYCLWPLDGEIMGYLRIIDVDDDYRLWTIHDAKDGDILIYNDSIFIFKETYGNYYLIYYGIYRNNKFHDDKCYSFLDLNTIGTNNIHPATELQHDILLRGMRKEGYEFDFEKKELKKIKQKPVWHAEDEKNLNVVLSFIKDEYLRRWLKDTIHKNYDETTDLSEEARDNN